MDVDDEPPRAYFRQMEYGLYTRMRCWRWFWARHSTIQTMTNFFSTLDERAGARARCCAWAGPHPADLPESTPAAALEFCLKLMSATADAALAFKPNAAFFEAWGAPGWAALAELIASAPPGVPVILDAKRGDIASTAEAYARSVFETLGADAVTLNPYLGRDSIEPFLANPEHGAFLLCKTLQPRRRRPAGRTA